MGIALSSCYFVIKGFLTFETRIPKNHVSVRFIIETEKKISSLILTSDNSNQKIELNGHSETLIVFPNYGEDEFKVCCIFKDQTEICSKGNYVESGYSPVLKITDTNIETISFH